MKARPWSALLLVLAASAACGARTGLPDDPPRELAPRCGASSLARAEAAPLDLSIVLDTSLSMADVTSADVQKWAAVTLALEQFLLDPRSAGMAVSLTFFPRPLETPDYCGSDADCPGDTCGSLRRCVGNFTRSCAQDADCASVHFPDDRCRPFGVCQSSGLLCDTGSPDACAADGGDCVQVPVCQQLSYCRDTSYQEPDVPLQPLPEGANLLRSAMLGQSLGASTPMLPALSGALGSARQLAPGRPGRVPVVVLATDGQPNACDVASSPAEAVAHVAAVAAQGQQERIATFVVGVLSAEEQSESQAYLDSIAMAGSSRPSLIVATGAQLTSDLLTALRQIRQEGAQCSYALPDVSPGTLDPDRLVVTLSQPGTATVSLTRQPTGCTGAPGYQLDTDVFGGDAPGRILLCPSVCQLLTGSPDATVSIEAGCL